MPQRTIMMRIFEVLYDESDVDHPLTHKEIIDILYNRYGITVERKAIGKHIEYLNDMGYEIVSTPKGNYLLEKLFEESELRLLIDSVLCSSHINKTHSKELIDKLVKLGGKYFKSRVKHICHVGEWRRSSNQSFFLNIDFVSEAIEKGKQITFDYHKYGVDKKLHKTKSHRVSPYQMILHNQHYFLMARNEKWEDITFYRMDKIKNVQIIDDPSTPINTVKGYEGGIDYGELANSRPYMYADKPERVEFICTVGVFDDVCEWFGTGVDVKELPDDKVEVSLMVSPMAMKYWALQYGSRVEVTSPATLREAIKNEIAAMADKYGIKCD
ncbi:MAG TPA: WYL domain-containing protein [Clostridia bacterium]|nr:WYL domain-containing protein [Clostridia bacterium]